MTRTVTFDMLLAGVVVTFEVAVTRTESDLGPEYRCELLRGSCGWDDIDDVEAAAIEVAEEEMAAEAAKAAALKGAA